MTNMARCSYIIKAFKKSSSPEATDRWPWNLVCTIVYTSSSYNTELPWPICQSQIWSHRLLNGQKWKWCILYLETIAVISLKVDLSIQINNLMKLNEYQRSRSFLGPWRKVTKISKLKLVFLRNSQVIWKQSLYESLWVNGNENLYKWGGSLDQNGPIYIR